MKRAAHFFIFFVFLFGFLFLTTRPTAAQSTNYYSPNSTNLAPGTPNDRQTQVQANLIEISGALICQLAGVNVINPQRGCLDVDPATHTLSYKTPSNHATLGGVLGFSTHMISILYQPTVSFTNYASYLSRNFGFSEKALAQGRTGKGFDSLSAIQSLWVTVRNITYLLLVIVFIIVGLGIMLRIQIDPRTTMSIQNQIPKIIIALVLITFSYAIAGLLVDGMWVTTYTGINIIADRELRCPDGARKDLVTTVATRNILNNPIAYVTDLFGDETGCLGSIDGIIGISGAVGITLGDILSRTILESLGFDAQLGPCKGEGILGIGVDITNCTKLYVFGFLKYLIGILVILILIVAVIIALFRLWFVLLRSFVYVIIGAITGPMWILAGLLPGSSLGFGKWIRFMAAHLLVFPAVVALIVLARVIYVGTTAGPDPNNPATNFIPPLIGNPNLGDNIGNLFTIGILFVLPEVLNLLRDALRSQPNKYVAPAIYKGFGRGAGPVMAPIAGTIRQTTRFDPRTQQVGGLTALGIRRLPGVRRVLTGAGRNFQRLRDEGRI